MRGQAPDPALVAPWFWLALALCTGAVAAFVAVVYGYGPGLEWIADPGSTGPAGAIARYMGGADVRVAYPGLWLRPDVYATHGHYLDCHMTVPRVECLFRLGPLGFGPHLSRAVGECFIDGFGDSRHVLR